MLIMTIKGTPTIQAIWKAGEKAMVIRMALNKIIPIHCWLELGKNLIELNKS
jgi:hypothetical protein